MIGKRWLSVVVLGMVVALASVCWATPGDVDGVNGVELKDAVTALQVSAGLTVGDVTLEGDVNSDDAIGVAEAVFALREVAFSAPGRGRAVLGPLAGATVNVYRLGDLETPIYTDATDADGYFDTLVSGVPWGEYLVVAVTGGEDTDADDDGVPDGAPTPNAGTIHALMTAAEFNRGGFQVTAISDIAWRYARNLVGQVDDAGLRIRLGDIARNFFEEEADIDGDGDLDENDIRAFDPTDAVHKGQLKFDYQDLFLTDDNGHSIINCYHGNKESVLPELLVEKFGAQMTLYPTPDTRNPNVKIRVVPFGRGQVASDAGDIDYDSERDQAENVIHDFFKKDMAQKVVLTATPTEATEILGWKGCDSVSEDLTQCECVQDRDHEVRVSFGYKEVKVAPEYVDLSRTQTTRTGDSLEVAIAATDAEMASKMAEIAAGWIVVSTANGGFLLEVTAVQKTDDYNYTLTVSENASLADVIQQGTGTFSRKITHGDLTQSGIKRRSGKYLIQTIDGVRILPSDDPEDTVFTVQFGQPSKERAFNCDAGDLSCHWDETVTIYETDNVKLDLAGSMDLEVDVDAGVSFGLVSGLEDFNFNVAVDTTETLDIIASGAFEWSEEISLFKDDPPELGQVTFFVGPVPVTIVFTLDIFLGASVDVSASVSTGVELNQRVSAGLVYSDGVFRPERQFNKSFKYNPPTIEENHLDVSGWIRPEAKALFWNVTGPAVSVKPSLNFNARALNTEEIGNYNCKGGIDYMASLQLEGELRWDFAGEDNKLGKFLNLDDLEDAATFSIFKKPLSWDIAKGNFLGYCLTPSKLEVAGDGIWGTYYEGSGVPISRQYTLSNTGDYDIEWAVEILQDGIISVSKTGGTLGGFETDTVDVVIDATKLDPSLIPYEWSIKFKNVTSSVFYMPDWATGSKYWPLVLSVLPTLSAPTLDQPVALSPNSVKLSWTYPAEFSSLYVNGYYVYQSMDNETWELASGGVVAGGDQKEFTVTGLLPDTMYYFAVTAFDTGSKEYDPSNKVRRPGFPIPMPPGDYENSLGMTFNLIPAGTFIMGSQDIYGPDSNTQPEHQVTLNQDFYMMTTEVTQAQWEAVMGSNPSYFRNCGGDCPMEKISWNEIQDFITALNALDGKTYRLPTEAEWEYAARAGTTTAFYNGDITETGCDLDELDPNLDAIGWYCGHHDLNEISTTHPVAQKQPNAWGLYDMSGNVWELVEDDYHSSYEGAPTDGGVWVDYPRSVSRVKRGGDYNSNAIACRSASRASLPAAVWDIGVGFRLALSPGR